MKLTVEVSAKTRKDFYDLRSELIEQDRQFDTQTLAYLPYHQLHLCCIGNAGDAVCSPVLVTMEKRARRQRFLSLEDDAFNQVESLLRYEEMHDDVIFNVNQQAAPHWDDLTLRQQAWAMLHCLWTHSDDMMLRLREAHDLLHHCKTRMMPVDVCMHYMTKLDGLMMSLGKLSDDMLRSQIEEVRDNVRDFLPEPELSICQREQIRGFVCTSDCFRIVV